MDNVIDGRMTMVASTAGSTASWIDCDVMRK